MNRTMNARSCFALGALAALWCACSSDAPTGAAGAAGASANTVGGGAGSTGGGHVGGTSSASESAGTGGGVVNAGGLGGAGANAAGTANVAGSGGTSASSAGSGGSSFGGAAGANSSGTSGAPGSGGSGGSISHTGKWRVMPLGDSITGTTCYPKLLSQELIAKGHSNFEFDGTVLNNQSCGSAPNVQTEGHGGFLITASTTLSAMPGWFASDRPDIVLMHFGTNDVWNSVDPSTILQAYSTAVDDVRAVNAKAIFFVAQIIPMHPAGCDACESRVEALDALIPNWASSKTTATSPITVVDMHSVFDQASYTPNSTYTTDGVHPNPSGSQLIADRWYQALSARALF